MKKLFCFILIIVIMAFAAGCSEEEFEESKTGLEYGFTTGGCDPHPGYYCGYKSNKREFDIKTVTMEFSYGTTRSSNYLQVYPERKNILIHVYLVNYLRSNSEYAGNYDFENNPYLFFIKEIDGFFDGQYKAKLVPRGANPINIEDIQYTHSEIITIPGEAFIGEIGRLDFVIKEYIIFHEDKEPEYGYFGAAILYYKVFGDSVVLSETPFEN
ncbi:MAG: hypothetical protein ACOYIN_03935 [Christensenellales bacterium]|jgi:hypothetical protein